MFRSVVDAEKLPLFARRSLWLVAVTANLTGFWLAPSATIVASGTGGGRLWILAGSAWIVFAGGILGWSSSLSSTSRRSELVRLAQIAVVTFAAFITTWVIAALIGMNYRACRPGQLNGPSTIAWIAPAIVYYSLGYLGFARLRWLRAIAPLAVIAAVLTLLAVEVIWTTGSGCGD
jgi:hypothetical protein